jgi:hypothetical protein
MLRSYRIALALIPVATGVLRGADRVELQAVLSREIIGPRQTMTEVQNYVEARIPRMKHFKTAAEWETEADRLRAAVLERVVYRGEAAAWRDAKTQVVWLDSIKGGPGYRIKKLRYEALPGLWIPALLYEPEKLVGKVPVVLNVNGHDGNGKAASYKQIRCINLAKRGLLALNVEWLGMGQLRSAGYHHGRMNQLDLCGTSGLAPFFLSMKRGLDLLLSLENADPERVAVTGLSGGGWQTIFISSLDTRVKLTNPVAGYSSFLTRVRHLKDLGDSEQTPTDLATVADYNHLTALMAPRPTLLTYNSKDNCCFESGYALPPLWEAATPFFKLYDKEGAFRSHVNDDPGSHNYERDNRQAFYRMVGDHFYPGDAAFDAQEIASDAFVKTKEELDVALPAKNEDLHSLALGLSKTLPRQPPDRNKLRDIVRAKDYQVRGEKVSSEEKGGIKITYWRLRMDEDWTVPVVELVRGQPKGTAILINDAGRRTDTVDVEQLLDAGNRVLAADLFYFGESKIQQRDYLFALLVATVGERPLGLQASQLAAIARWSQSEHKSAPVTLVAVGPRLSTAALVAAVLEEKAIGKLELHGALKSLKEVIEQNRSVEQMPELFCFGLLEAFDIKQLSALVAPRPILHDSPTSTGKEKTLSPKNPAALSKQVLSLLQARCTKCHGAREPKARLNLSSLEAIARGSRKGPVVVAGKPEDSLIWKMVHEGKMPPENPTLSDAEAGLLRRWIASGAPGLPAAKGGAAGPVHWAFQPPDAPLVPEVQHKELVRTGIDRFVEAALESKKLCLGPEADRATLVRRVSFDLTGLPPTPAELDAFLADTSPIAYERMVERYLASPHYGERWGKYWLDAAGYADSNGYFSADSDRPLAYRYRDYVIRSLNEDKPYDQFVREQLAGDEIAGFEPTVDVTGTTADLLMATHFLRNAPDGTGESDGNPDEVRTDRFTVLEGTLQITMSSLLGLTIQCARCHEHKFEPIRHDEYYQLQAIFYPGYCPDRWVKPNDRVVKVGTRAQRQEYQRRTEELDRQIKELQTRLEAATAPFRERLIEERLQPLKPEERAVVLKAFQTPKDKKSPEQQALLKSHAEALKFSEDDLTKRYPEFAAMREPIRKEIGAHEKERPQPLERLAVFVETDANSPAHHVLLRGQHDAPGPKVQPGVPAALCSPGNVYQIEPRPVGYRSSGRRTAFAKWVTSRENPLFARVMVNRIWQHHFGVGLVSTPDNFGQSGARPSHPELLDFLATEFIRSGWSMKALHRLILSSGVYRQSGALREQAFQMDPENRLLWRFSLRRLDAEALRDAMLAVTGELDRRAGGPYVPTQRLPEGNVEVDEKRADARRRSVYLQQRRTQVATLLELFDAPSVVANCTYRATSTVPLQSLALLNSNFALVRAQAFAARLDLEVGADAETRIRLAFRLGCTRQPTAEELAAARRFLSTQQQQYTQAVNGRDGTWADFCQMILASNAFLYIE